ncbi:hypothetical protein EJB05_41671, partial [Eragrostis curvula]
MLESGNAAALTAQGGQGRGAPAPQPRQRRCERHCVRLVADGGGPAAALAATALTNLATIDARKCTDGMQHRAISGDGGVLNPASSASYLLLPVRVGEDKPPRWSVEATPEDRTFMKPFAAALVQSREAFCSFA